uniref:Uncharacterized protein n=1 Tax=Avena sativa TaxID=4498 RepID=A0ACD5ZEX3_AVESA
MEPNGGDTPRHPMAFPHASSASRAGPALANFVRSLRKAASFGYSKASAGVVDAAGTTRRYSAVTSPCRSSPGPGFAARGARDPETRRRRSAGESGDVGRRPGGVPGTKMRTTRRDKEDEARKEDAAHRARVLTARLLQWRFANARLEKAMARAASGAQGKLLYAWLRVAELRNIHAAKQIVAQRWRQKIKLGRPLRTQIALLGTWEPLGESHADAVVELGRVLSAAAASLPLTDGAQVHVRNGLSLPPCCVSDRSALVKISMILHTYLQLQTSLSLELLHETLLACVRTVDEIEANTGMFYATGGVVGSAAVELAGTIRQEIAGLEEAMRLSTILTGFLVQEVSLRANLVQAMQKID